MRPLVILFAIPVLLISLAVGWYFNQDFERQSLSDDIVKTMLGASSYRATGIDMIEGAREVREQFEYVAPNSIHSLYTTTARDSGFGARPSECTENEVVMIGTSGYQRCLSKEEDWQTFSSDSSVFNRLSFQPWRRLEWCTTFTEEDTRIIAGEKTKVISCTVPVEREAEADYGTDDSEQKLRFIANASIGITAWVREDDGYITRFAMTKRIPGSFGSTIQTLDYSYSDFGIVPPLRPPEISTEPDISASVVEPDVGPTGQPSVTVSETNFTDLFSGDNTP
jgi:hypothetical protein